MSNNFWRNLALICVAHVIAIIGVIRWNAGTASNQPQNIVWLADEAPDAGGKQAAESHPASSNAKPAPIQHPEQTPGPDDQDYESLLLASAKSEIELPAPTPSATPTPTVIPTPRAKPSPTPLIKKPPKPSPRPPRKPRPPKPTPRPTATPTPKPRPKETVLAKAKPRPTPEEKEEEPVEADEPDDEPKADQSQSPNDSEQRDRDREDTPREGPPATSAGTSSGPGGGNGGGAKSSELVSYGRMLHDRFYGEWDQPTSTVASTVKISTLVRVRIEKNGRVSHFEIIRPSGNVLVDESVAAMGKRVTQVDPLPSSLRSRGHYDLKINFELNSD